MGSFSDFLGLLGLRSLFQIPRRSLPSYDKRSRPLGVLRWDYLQNVAPFGSIGIIVGIYLLGNWTRAIYFLRSVETVFNPLDFHPPSAGF